MFEVVKMEGEWWAVFLINPVDSTDRYMVAGTFDKKSYAEHFVNEFNRILAVGVA